MKTINSSLFGNIPKPETFIELLELITFDGHKENKVHFWRGQSNINWAVDHSAYRRLRIDKTNVTSSDLKYYERSLMGQATHKGFRFQNGRELKDLELLSKLQHHGAATRLVDFSRNALVALWFAVNELSNEDGLLIGLNTDYLRGYESIEDFDNLFLLDNEDREGVFTFEPPIVTARIAAQHSQFLYSSLSTEKTGSLFLPQKKDATCFIAIDKNLKCNIVEILELSFDIRPTTLFPDVDGFGNANSHMISKSKMWRW